MSNIVDHAEAEAIFKACRSADYFGVFVTSLALTTVRAGEEDRPEKRQQASGAADDRLGKGGASAPAPSSAAAGESGQRSASTLTDNNNTADPVNKDAFAKKAAERGSKFTRSSKHRYGWDNKWRDEFKWIIPVYEEKGDKVIGALCSTCQRHNQAQRNGEMSWSRVPVATLRRDIIRRHHNSVQHKEAQKKELAMIASVFNRHFSVGLQTSGGH